MPNRSLPADIAILFNDDAPAYLDDSTRTRIVELMHANDSPDITEFKRVTHAQRANVALYRAARESHANERLADKIPLLIEANNQRTTDAIKLAAEAGVVSWAQMWRDLGRAMIDAPKHLVAAIGDAGAKLGWMTSSFLAATVLVLAAGSVIGARRLEVGPTGFSFYTPTELSSADDTHSEFQQPPLLNPQPME